MLLYKQDAMQNVLSIQIVRLEKHVLINAVKIHVKRRRVVSMPNVVFTIIPQIVTAKMDLWVMLLFIVCQYHRLEIQQPIRAFHHHVCREAFVKYMEM